MPGPRDGGSLLAVFPWLEEREDCDVLQLTFPPPPASTPPRHTIIFPSALRPDTENHSSANQDKISSQLTHSSVLQKHTDGSDVGGKIISVISA